MRTPRLAGLAAGLALSLTSVRATAQTTARDVPPLAADRPGFTESPGTVGHRVLQVEAGFTLGFDPGADTSRRSLTAPDALVRLGIGDRLELRLAGAGFAYTSERAGRDRVSTRGISDLYVGGKAIVLEEDRDGLELSVVPGVTLPTGSEALSGGSYAPSIIVAFARRLPRGFDLSGVWSVAASATPDGRHGDYAASAALSRTLAGPVSAVGEVFRVASWHEPATWSLNGGCAVLLGIDLQIDVQVGREVRNDSGWTMASGLVVRHR